MVLVFVDVVGEWKFGGVEYLKFVDFFFNIEEFDLFRLLVL